MESLCCEIVRTTISTKLNIVIYIVSLLPAKSYFGVHITLLVTTFYLLALSRPVLFTFLTSFRTEALEQLKQNHT